MFPRGGMLELFGSGLVGILLVLVFIMALAAGRRELAAASLLAGLPWFSVPVVLNRCCTWSNPTIVLSPLGTAVVVVALALGVSTFAVLVARRRGDWGANDGRRAVGVRRYA